MSATRLQVLIDNEPLEMRWLNQVSRVEVRENDQDATMAAIRFHLVQEPGGTFGLLDDEVCRPGRALAIEIASPGSLPRRLFDGFVSHIRPHFETIEANGYLEVLALDIAWKLDAEDRAETYPDASDSEAARQIFARHDVTAVIEETAAVHDAQYHLLTQRCSDWKFLRKLAKRNGYSAYFEFDDQRQEVVGYFGPPQLESNPQADLTILQQDTNLRWIDLQLVATGPVRHAGAVMDPIRKRIIEVDDDRTQATLGEPGLIESIESELGVSLTGWLPDPYPLDAQLQSQGKAAAQRDAMLIEARGEIESEVYRGLLRARRPVLIKGVGRLFSGTYYVQTVRTTLADGLLVQTFIAWRNALGQTGQEEFGQQASEEPAL